MKQINEKSLCCGCEACAQICPKKCIVMERDREGFLYPITNDNACISCGLCERVCPVLGKDSFEDSILNCYVGYAEEEEIRRDSSSGGIFSLLGIAVLRAGGVLYGAAMDEQQMVRHIRIDSVSSLRLLRGSKYLQSKIMDTFIEAKRDLEAGHVVLYSGTACQIAGLKKFLQKEYKRLYTVDVLCHGVPSPIIWKKYLKWQSRRHGAESLRHIFFRNKIYGWKRYSMELLFNNGKRYTKAHGEDVFMQMFLENICLRPSCHDCRFKALGRVSDLSIGDAWGIDLIDSEMDDDRGTSIIMTHTLKGEQILKEIAPNIRMHRTDVEQLLPPSADSRRSVEVHPWRKCFFVVCNLFGTGIFTMWHILNLGKRIKRKACKLFSH